MMETSDAYRSIEEPATPSRESHPTCLQTTIPEEIKTIPEEIKTLHGEIKTSQYDGGQKHRTATSD